jgi:alkylation response protein AidB-like acyl-CoA dehydrogenase
VKLDLSSDQELFRETCQRFLTDTEALAQARRSADWTGGFDRSWWRVATEIGLAAMFIPEDHGGGSVSGAPICDAVIAAEEMGKALAPGPFHPVNLVAYAIARSGTSGIQEQLLSRLGAGDLVGSWAFGEPRSQWNPAHFTTEVNVRDGALVVHGTKSYV